MQASPGDARVALNYEPVFSGGFASVGGIERFDGGPSPSAARYTLLPGVFAGLAVGDVVEGDTSGATAWVAQLGNPLVVTEVVGTFVAGEDLLKSAVSVGTILSSIPTVTGALDNDYSFAAAEVYRQLIGPPPGSGPARGVAILANQVYAWRDDAGAGKIYKATSTGWQLVPLLFEVAFGTGSVAPTEGGTVTKGGVSAVVRRIVVETGTWSGGDAAGRLICDAPSGTFTAGAITAGGTLMLTATLDGNVQRQVALLPGGRVQTTPGNFTAATATRRLYGCDGVNPEFEFDGEVYVPLSTGMPTRARAVAVHKSRLWFGFESSVQYSGISDPYKWTPLFGAQELGTGDGVTNMVTISGSEDKAALMVACQDSLHVMYGSSTADFQMIPLSGVRGALQYSMQELMTPIGMDQGGLVSYAPTQAFGNYASEVISRLINDLVLGRTPLCSVLVRGLIRYRLFFEDGVISCTPSGNGFRFTRLDYGRAINVAVSGEINGAERVFYGGMDGWIYEADVGRSFDGEPIDCRLKLAALSQRSPVVEKAYREAYLEVRSTGYIELDYSAEYDDGDPSVDPLLAQQTRLLGSGGVFDRSLFDRAYFDARERDRRQLDLIGCGYSIAPIFLSSSDRQLPHELSTLTLMYLPRRFVK